MANRESFHKRFFEKSSLILTLGIIVTVSIGGLVETATSMSARAAISATRR